MHRDLFQRKYAELRKQAEDRLANGHPIVTPPEDIDTLRHEVAVQHIELEMQHDELMKAHHELGEQRIQAEHNLARYRKFFDLSQAAMLALTAKGVITECNAAFARMAGQTANGLSGRTLAEFVAPEDRMNFDVLFKQETHRPTGRKFAFRIAGKQGNATPVSLSIAFLNGDSEAYLATLVECGA